MSAPFSLFRLETSTRLLYAVAKTSPVIFVLPDLSAAKIFFKWWTTLDQNISGKKRKKTPGGQSSGWVCRIHVQIFRVSLSKTTWRFGLFVCKMSKIAVSFK